MLSIKNLVKSFNNKEVVKDISFEIKAGEILSLIGPNGSGKTTIIKMITGLLQPSSGEIIIGGEDIVKSPEKAKLQIGYIPDEPSIWPYMTGEEFIHFTSALYSIPVKERNEKLPELLAKFNLEGIEKEYFEDYSRGNKQKFSVLAAFAHQPKLLLIDEPIVGLDPSSAVTAKEEFAKFAQDGGGVMLVTHTLSVAEEISDRIGVLSHGKLVALDTLENLRKLANLSESASLEEIYQKLV
jgi:ABC-2 type transport system ATP-binding protein